MSYIRGRYAKGACDLLDYLKSLGIGCKVGYRDNAKKRDNTLIVRGIRSGDREKIPATFQNFKVKAECD